MTNLTNDLLLRVLEAGLRVESVPVRSVYGAEVSGIRPHVAVPAIVGLLARGWARRVTAEVPRAARAEAGENR